MNDLFVKSHVARDPLQNAGLFKTEKLVVWEYVSNGLQYVSPGINPVVKVTLDTKKKRITVQDNGRGMDWEGLRNFFVMHGENIDRKEGHPGRGRFGTGKSAAFGIAEVLRLTTARNGKRTSVELRRSNINAMTSEAPIPVQVLEQETKTTSPNGTLVEIEDVHLRSLDTAAVIRYIERHLAKWPKNATVFVNNHECEFSEPAVAAEYRYTPEGANAEQLGDVQLVIKVSKSPLEEDLRGISIFANGVWHETTFAGSEGREMVQYIFGEIDIPHLDEDNSPIAPFDVSRSMTLNPQNELVRAIHAFVGRKVEEVRRGLCDREKQRRAAEDAKKLAAEAREIARVINEDFDAFRQRVAKVRAKTRGSSDLNQIAAIGDTSDDDLAFGTELPANIPPAIIDPGQTSGNSNGGIQREQNPDVVPSTPESPRLGRPAGGAGSRPRPTGGFHVEFRPMGADQFRAQYVPQERTIYINLEHPQLAAALGLRNPEDPIFRRLAYEVAFSEYAIALAQELARRDEYLDPTDPIFDIRETINRVARKGATLYAE